MNNEIDYDDLDYAVLKSNMEYKIQNRQNKKEQDLKY